MKEVEIKIRNIDKEDIIKKITDLGARKNFCGKVIDHRFDTPDRTLSKQGKALRIRQKGNYVYINLKGKKDSSDNITGREELSLRVFGYRNAYRILTELGYVKIFELSKTRTEYKMEGVKFDIDEYLGMEAILEIESDNNKTVQEYVDKLGITKEDLGRVYIREILAAKKKYDFDKKKEEIYDLLEEHNRANFVFKKDKNK